MSEKLNHKQQSILRKLRQQLEDENIIQEGDTIGTSDPDLLRFLRARNFNLKHSKDMIVKCQQWRKSVQGIGIDKMYNATDPFDLPERDLIFVHWPIYFHKTDKLGRPLNIEKLGGINLAALYADVTPERHREILMVIAESFVRDLLPACSRSSGKLVETGVAIVDLEGFSLSQFWQLKNLLRDQFQIAQDYYPETMGKLVFINAPTTFAYAWSVVKLWLSKETIEKVDILDANYKDALLDLIDEENLPEMYGGKCKCEGAGGCVMSSAGPWKDEKMMTKTSENVEDEK